MANEDSKATQQVEQVTPWTPGPWHVQAEYEGEDGLTIEIPEIKRLLHDPEWADEDDWNRDLANAHLIAAAPALYEALYLMRTAGGSWLEVSAKADAALAAARGEVKP